MTLTLPEIEVSIAKLEKVWREVGGDIDHTYKNVDEDVLRAFAAKHRLDVDRGCLMKERFCTLQITKGQNQLTVTLWSPITENKQKAPVAAGA